MIFYFYFSMYQHLSPYFIVAIVEFLAWFWLCILILFFYDAITSLIHNPPNSYYHVVTHCTTIITVTSGTFSSFQNKPYISQSYSPFLHTFLSNPKELLIHFICLYIFLFWTFQLHRITSGIFHLIVLFQGSFMLHMNASLILVSMWFSIVRIYYWYVLLLEIWFVVSIIFVCLKAIFGSCTQSSCMCLGELYGMLSIKLRYTVCYACTLHIILTLYTHYTNTIPLLLLFWTIINNVMNIHIRLFGWTYILII